MDARYKEPVINNMSEVRRTLVPLRGNSLSDLQRGLLDSILVMRADSANTGGFQGLSTVHITDADGRDLRSLVIVEQCLTDGSTVFEIQMVLR